MSQSHGSNSTFTHADIVQTERQNGEDLRDFKCSMVVGVRQHDLSMSQTADLL